MDIIRNLQSMNEKLQGLTTAQLIDAFIMTGKGKDSEDRAWIVFELERRDPEAFRAWLDSEDHADDENVRKYFN